MSKNITEHGQQGETRGTVTSPAYLARKAEPNPAGRDRPAGFLSLVALLALLPLTCTAAPKLVLELEHISHPLAGWPCEPQKWSEDDVTQANVLLRWRKAGFYFDAGLGWNLQGRNGGGFMGPAFTGTVRIGREFRLGGGK